MIELLEREEALATLRALLSNAAMGTGHVVLIGGEAGIGKSALVEHFTRDHQTAARVLWGACDPLFSPRPLGPLHDIAGQVQDELPALLKADANRHAIFDACLREFQRESTIVVVEDLHWADEATLDLLTFLGRRIHRIPTLLIATYRDDELRAHHPLRALLGALATPNTTRLLLTSLSERGVRTLIGGRAFDPVALHRQTGGNPFFVTEVLADTHGRIPSTVRDAVLARVASLSPPARAVLDAAAVIGARVELDLLRAVVHGAAAAVDECLAIGVLVAQDNTLAFRHELARQTILEAIPLHQRMTFHRLVLEALQVLAPARTNLARLAHHAQAAGDSAAVLYFAPAAAHKAGLSGAHREAVGLFELALSHAGALAPEQHATLLEAYAQHCSRIDQRAKAIDAHREAIRLWHEIGDPIKEGENLALLVIMLIGMGRNAEAEQASEAAIALFESQASVQHLAKGYETRAALLDFNSDHAEAIAWCTKILALDGLDQQTYEWRRTCMRMSAARMFLDYERGCAELEHLLRSTIGAVRDDPALDVEAANLYQNLGVRSMALFHFDRAERYLAEGLSYIAERDLHVLRTMMLAAQALTKLYQGNWNAASDLASDVLQRPGASVISRIVALQAIARLRGRRGDPGAQVALDEALRLAIPTGNIQRIGPVHAARAEAAWFSGDHERTLVEARAAYNLAAAKHQAWITGELAFWRWRAGDKVAIDAELARPFALQISGNWCAAAEEWQRMGCPYEQARALGDGDTAAQLAALSIFDHLGARAASEELRARLRTTGMHRIPRGPHVATRENAFNLTAREMEILARLAEDLTNTEIATRLHLSAKTVDHHVSAVLAKLQVHSRRAAVELAHTQRILVKDGEPSTKK